MRNGLDELAASQASIRTSTYYKPTKAESVEMEEALNAEQAVEVASDMQLCARTVGVRRANAPKDRNLVMLRERSSVNRW